MTKKLSLILLIPLGLRLLSLNQSLWLDEAISANVVKNYSYSDIITKFSPSDFHPPLYYLTLKAWTSIFGYSEISLRFPSVIFSLITIYLVFKFFGFWPSLLLAFNPLYLYYSQEARMYSLVTLLVFCAYLAFKTNKLFIYYLFVFLSLSTFYGSVFFFAAISLYWLFKKNYKNFIIYSLAPGFSFLILSPLLWQQYQISKTLLVSVENWSLVLGPATFKNLLLILTKFTLGRISFYPKWLYYFISLIFTTPLWLLVFLRSFKQRKTAFIFWVTLAVAFVFSLFTPMFQYFRFLYLIPFLCLILHKNYFYTFIFLIFSLVYLLNSNFHREDWQSLSASLINPIYIIESVADPIKYYRPDLKINDLKSISPAESEITVIPYASEIHGFDYRQKLLSQDYQLIKETSFRELKSETWQKLKK
ncbi:MAG TPA: glycosyltransferase family 39 protein [Candidatus Woesebacteria bacterium]|nr:glycosyltransferase family 39 protein [Candidatus Woesebacteria bacterium]